MGKNKRIQLQEKLINLIYEYIDECIAEDQEVTLDDIAGRVGTLGKIAVINYKKSITM